MRRIQHGSESESNSYLQAGLATGYLCRRAEEELERIGAATSGAVSARELGEWMGRFLLSKSEANQIRVHNSQRLSEVRSRPTEGYALGAGETEAHVRPRHHRTLSVRARKAISKAQRERWKKFHTAKGGNLRDQLRAQWRKAKQKSRAGIKMPPSQRSATSKNVRDYWAKMTPAQRSAEMIRRRQVAAAKAKKEGRTAFMRELVDSAENRPTNGAA